jgi:hypothetical protein
MASWQAVHALPSLALPASVLFPLPASFSCFVFLCLLGVASFACFTSCALVS